MKIALFIQTLNPASGGVASALVEMALALRGLGHTPTLISFDDPRAPFLLGLPEGVVARAIGPSRGAWGKVPALDGKLSDLSFDVVVLNGLWLYSTAGAARWAEKNKIPYVVFPHGMLDPYFKRFFFKHLKKSLYWLAMESRTIAHADCICYATASEKLLAQKTFFPFCPRRQEVVGLGLETFSGDLEAAKASFREHFPMLSGGAPYLLYLSRFHPKKGADMLLKALHEFPDLRLVMAGPLVGSDGLYANRLKAMAPSGRVVWTGMLTGELKWGALAGAGALILPSHQENFGMVVAEALSCGRPVLISNKVALSEEVSAAKAGLVAPDTLAGTRSLLKDFQGLSSERLEAMRVAAHACYARNFQPSSVAERFASLLEKIAAKS